MATCPNRNLQSWKDLESLQGESLAMVIWDRFEGRPPEFFYTTKLEEGTTISKGFDVQTRFNEEQNNAILDSIIYMLMERKKQEDFKIGDHIGDKSTRGAIPNFFLQQAYETENNTSPSLEVAERVWKKEQAYEKSVRENASQEEQDKLYNEWVSLMEEEGIYEVDHPGREAFLDIYEFWNGGIITSGKTEQEIKADAALGNTDVVGWRELLANRMKLFGYSISNIEQETEFATDEDILERIYSKSSMEEDPSKKLTGRMKELLATIPNKDINFLGFQTYLPVDQVYKELSTSFAGLQNFPEMLAQVETLALHKPQYSAVADFMMGLNKKDAATFSRVFAQSANEFLLIRVEAKTPAGDVVRMFNPNENRIERSIATTWKNGAVESNIAKPKAIYKVTEAGLEIDQTKARKIAESWLGVRRGIAGADNVLSPQGEVSVPVQALTELLWNMGIYLGDPEIKEETANNLQQIVNTGIFVVDNGRRQKLTGRAAFNYIANREGKSLARLVSQFVVLSPDGTKIERTLKSVGSTVFESQGSTVRHIASFAPLFFDMRGDSFVNGKGKQIYPINLRHHLGQIFEVLGSATEDKTEMMDMYGSDRFFKPVDGRPEFDSLLYRLLQSDEYTQEFKAIDLDALKDVTIPDGTVDYENFSNSDSLRTRLIAYINSGNRSVGLVAIPVQSDRKKFTFFPFARTKNLAGTRGGTYGITGMTKNDIIFGMIAQDMMRIAHGRGILSNQVTEDGLPNPPKDLPLTYIKNLQSPQSMQFDGTVVGSEGNIPIVTDAKLESKNGEYFISDFIEEYLTTPEELKEIEPDVFNEIQTKINIMVERTNEYFLNQAKKLNEKITTQSITLPVEAREFGDRMTLLENYVFDEFMGRNEISKILRGSRAHVKDIQTFYKRIGHGTTPGMELALASDLTINGLEDVDGIANYGMPDTFIEATFEDIRLNLNEEMRNRAIERANAIRDGLIEAGYDAEFAELLAEEYYPDEVEGTDAQGIISIDFYRDLMQGKGEWTINEEKAYDAYKAAPTGSKQFVYQEGFTPQGFKVGDAVPVYPQKPYYERNELVGGVVATDSHKNSYHLLLEGETKNNPVKDNLRRRMEAVGEYSGLQRIGVANFVTAKKIKVNKVNTLTETAGALANVEFNTVNSKGLRFPQEIPKKKASTTMFNRQVRKNTISNINSLHTYTLNAGLDTEIKISGQEMLDMYHAAIERKIKLEFAKVEKELGIDKIQKALAKQDVATYNQSMIDFHKKLRDKLKDNNIERDLPTNYDAGLKIELDPAGRPQFKVPLDFPVYFEKYQRVILGMAINEAFKQKVPGMEAVQVAEIGGYAESGELEFLKIEKDKSGTTRVAHMEVMIREDVARKFGLEVGQDLNNLPEELRRIIGYRIPNQGKSSTVIMKIKRILPANYAKAVIVPAQLTKLMGSDFDVDKMFLMFPEVRMTDAGPVKIRPPYEALLGIPTTQIESTTPETSIDKITDVSILNNIILDIVEAVQSNLLHVNESMAPLDESTLPKLVADIETKFPELQAPLEFASAEIETEMGIRNTIGRAMRGLWANFIAGHAVAAYGDITVNPMYELTLDGKPYSQLIGIAGQEVESFDKEVPINMIGSRYLSAAVDAAKKPYQYTLNDRTFTYPVESYWIAFSGDTKALHDFLNVPIIREFTDNFYTKYGAKPILMENALLDVIPKMYKDSLKQDRLRPSTPMSREELSDPFDLTPERQYELLLNFLKFREAGRSLSQMFKVIAPDSMDGMNSIDSIKSYRSRQNQFNPSITGEENQIFVNSNDPSSPVVDQFIGDNSVYGMQRGFSNLFLDIADMASKIFPMTVSPALDNLDTKIMDLTGNTQLNPEAHREIRRAAMLSLFASEGSPLREFFSESHLQSNYLNRESNLVTKLRDMKVKHPKLAQNLFIRKFVENNDNDLPETRVYLLDFDTSYQMTRFEKDAVTLAAYRLLKRPEEIVGKDASIEDRQSIINLAEDLLMNTLIVHGFKQTTGSYQDLIPVTFFTENRYARYNNPGERLGTAVDFFRKQLTAMYITDTFDNFATDFIRQNYTQSPGGYTLVQGIRKKETPNELVLNDKDKIRMYINGYPIPFITITNSTTNETFLYASGHILTSGSVQGKYVKVNPLGVDGKLIEATNPDKSIINAQGLPLSSITMTSTSTGMTTNAGNIAATKEQQDIICK